MTYADLDPVIYPWSKKFGLHIYTFIRDDEIRSMDIVDDSGDIYKLHIFPADKENQSVSVGIWDGKNKHAEYQTSLPLLETCLDDAYAKVSEWINSRGHTRTIY